MKRDLLQDFADHRSPVYRQFEGASYWMIAGQRQAVHMDGSERKAALFDLSLMPRFGLRGAGAATHLRERHFSLPLVANTAVASVNDTWVARLGATEYWVLCATREETYPLHMNGPSGPEAGCYPVPCSEGRAWFVLQHAHKAQVMAKLCGVDLRESVFPQGSVVQSSVANVNAVIIHHTVYGKAVFSLFSDVATACYLWNALDDALEEFGAGGAALESIIRVSGR